MLKSAINYSIAIDNFTTLQNETILTQAKLHISC